MRFKVLSILLCVALCVSALLILAPTLVAPTSAITPADPGEAVTFRDPNLEAAISRAIGKPTGDIYQSDLETLTELYASGRDIEDLSGLEYCTSLTWLSLDRNQISDLTPHSGLTSLTFPQLEGQRVVTQAPSIEIWLRMNQKDYEAGLTDYKNLSNLITDIRARALKTNISIWQSDNLHAINVILPNEAQLLGHAI